MEVPRNHIDWAINLGGGRYVDLVACAATIVLMIPFGAVLLVVRDRLRRT